jgi:hypothetical protein
MKWKFSIVAIRNKGELSKCGWERESKEKSGEVYKDKIENDKMLCDNITGDKLSENKTS